MAAPRIIVAATLMAFLAVGAVALQQAAPTPAQPSQSDSKLLWTRIRHRFHVRVESEFSLAPDQLAFEPDEHDPLHWSRIWFPEPVNYLLKGGPYQEAIALLDEFLTKEGEKLESDPLQRALLQHDL